MKYIILRGNAGRAELVVPVIFPVQLVHASVAKLFLLSMPGFEVTSAGFYDQKNGGCYGKSESLGIGSDPEEDEKTIRGMK